MKKITPFVIVALFGALTFTSCKKDYKCNCKIPQGSSTGTDTTYSIDLGKSKKSDATNKCNTLNTSASIVGGSCSI